MLIFLKPRLVLFSMPKCASSSIEAVLGGRADMRFSAPARVKHMSWIDYGRFVLPLIEHVAAGPFETVCLMREPLDWQHSWWRYRRREDVAHPENSTSGMSFEVFLTRYMDRREKPADRGPQSRMIVDGSGRVGVDSLWRYERIDAFAEYLVSRLGLRRRGAAFRRLTAHDRPQAGAPDISDAVRARFRAHEARDYEIHQASRPCPPACHPPRRPIYAAQP